jgi:ribosomal protein L29
VAKGKISSEKQIALSKHFESLDKENIEELSKHAQNVQAQLFEEKCKLLLQQIEANKTQIQEYEAQRTRLQGGSGPDSVGFQDSYADKAGIPRAAPVPLPQTEGKDNSDNWTSISFRVSSSYSHEQTETQSTSFSAGGAASWGLWSVGASVSHSDSHSNALKQMSNAEVKVSFECMRVDIARPWLRGELFYDHDLRVATEEQ